MVLLGCITTRFINEDNYAEPSEREANIKAPLRRPLQLFMEVWKESAFRKLIPVSYTHLFRVLLTYRLEPEHLLEEMKALGDEEIEGKEELSAGQMMDIVRGMREDVYKRQVVDAA